MMRYRMSFLVGLAVGFVLGTRAGRERYEQIKQLSRRVADNPSVQQAAGTFQTQATDLAKTAQQQAADLAKAAQNKVSGGLHDSVPKAASAAKDKAADHIPGLRRKNGGQEDELIGNGHGTYPPHPATRDPHSPPPPPPHH